MAFHVEINIRN